MNLLKTILPNQLVKEINATNFAYWNGVATYDNGIATITKNVQNALFYTLDTIDFIQGHRYYLSIIAKGTTNGIPFRIYTLNGAYNGTIVGANLSTSFERYDGIIVAEGTLSAALYFADNQIDNYNAIQLKEYMLIDLTEEGSGITTVEQFRAKYPLPYYPYRTTTVNALVTANNAPVTADISSMLPSGIGVVDLGTINYNKVDVEGQVVHFESILPISGIYAPPNYTTLGQLLCYKYFALRNWVATLTDLSADMEITIGASGSIAIVDSSLSNLTPTEFKSAVSGTQLLFRKANI